MSAPRWYSLYVELAATAERLLADRERLYPPQVGRGAMTAAAANDGIRIMRAIAADWQAARDGLPLPAPDQATQAEKLATLTTAASRAAQLAAAEPGNRSRGDYAELVDTLLWQQQDWHSTSRIRWFHQLTLDLRAASPLPEREGSGEGVSATHAQAA